MGFVLILREQVVEECVYSSPTLSKYAYLSSRDGAEGRDGWINMVRKEVVCFYYLVAGTNKLMVRVVSRCFSSCVGMLLLICRCWYEVVMKKCYEGGGV